MTMADFDKYVQQRKALQSWWNLRTIRTYDSGGHVLRVDVPKPTMVAMCGQNHPGARNYHDAPDFFAEAIKNEMDLRAKEITKTAYENEIMRLDSLIAQNKEAVLAELATA